MVLSILYYTHWKDHTCRYVKYTVFLLPIFLYNGRIKTTLYSVLIQRKTDKSKIRLLAFLCNIFGLFSPTFCSLASTAISGRTGAATDHSEFWSTSEGIFYKCNMWNFFIPSVQKSSFKIQNAASISFWTKFKESRDNIKQRPKYR